MLYYYKISTGSMCETFSIVLGVLFGYNNVYDFSRDLLQSIYLKALYRMDDTSQSKNAEFFTGQ